MTQSRLGMAAGIKGFVPPAKKMPQKETEYREDQSHNQTDGVDNHKNLSDCLLVEVKPRATFNASRNWQILTNNFILLRNRRAYYKLLVIL
jgi:hypothetical protein